MPNVVHFSRHARSSADCSLSGTRAAKSVRRSAVRLASIAVLDDRSSDHHSLGMLSRCHHLLTCDGVAPVSAAIASRVSQNSMMDRKEVISVIEDTLRQYVLKRKSIVSHDCGELLGQNVFMDEKISASEYKAGFLGRVKAARESRFEAAIDLCIAMDLKQPTYSKYEVRSLMPHSLIPRFCAACGVTADWLFTAKGAGPLWKPVYSSTKP